MFLAREFFWGECSPDFWTGIIKHTQIPIRWLSFRAIGRGNSENGGRKKRKKETSLAFYKSSVTTVPYTGGLIIIRKPTDKVLKK